MGSYGSLGHFHHNSGSTAGQYWAKESGLWRKGQRQIPHVWCFWLWWTAIWWKKSYSPIAFIFGNYVVKSAEFFVWLNIKGNDVPKKAQVYFWTEHFSSLKHSLQESLMRWWYFFGKDHKGELTVTTHYMLKGYRKQQCILIVSMGSF